MAVPIKTKPKAAQTSADSMVTPRTATAVAPIRSGAHTSKKITEMIIVMVVVLLIIFVALFITQVSEFGRTTIVNNYYYGDASSAQGTAAKPVFQPITAPTGQAVDGYPKTLIPAHGKITASYHNQYNGYDQYTLVVSASSTLANEYTAFQQFLTANKFKISQKTAASTEDTINAQQGMDYVTVQLIPNAASTTTVTINYGTPIQ
jgi:hypothetical protein